MEPTEFVIYSKKRENNESLICGIRSELEQNGFRYNETKPDLILVFGGDGSLMRAVHEYKGKGRYLLLNTGHLGFYSDFHAEESQAFVQALLHQEPKEEFLPSYTFTIDGESHHFTNDVALQSGETCFMRIYVNDELLTESKNNGIVVSTPVGTTGYLTSLGSPVVIGSPDIYQYALLAPCYNRMFPNPIHKAILTGKDVLRVEIAEGIVDIYVDGGKKKESRNGTFTFRHNKTDGITLLHLRDTSYVSRLRKNISGKD